MGTLSASPDFAKSAAFDKFMSLEGVTSHFFCKFVTSENGMFSSNVYAPTRRGGDKAFGEKGEDPFLHD